MSGLMRRPIAALAAACILSTAAPNLSFAGPNTAHQVSKEAPKAASRPAERAAFTAADLAAARPAGLAQTLRVAGDDPNAFQALIDEAPAASDPWLVLSGGGEDGAFAAGLLAGWSEAGTRPDFGVITGVSTGALIAPFAFVGRAGDGPLREAYTTITAADVFEFGGSDVALTDTWPLKRRIDKAVTPELLQAVAAEHAKGRRLLVATTEIDSGRPVLWDMGAIATAAGPKGAEPRALGLFRAVVLASSAVPGVFPPVEVSATLPDGRTIQELHADGGTTAPFYLAPKRALTAALTGAQLLRIPARSIYVVVNNSTSPSFEMARRSTLSVLGRAMSAAIKAQLQDALALTGAFARREGLDLHVAEIDGRFKAVSPGPFDQRYMQALYAHGRALGRDGAAFAGSTGATAQGDAPQTLARR
ncbi:patatin-like phospholipase family protein [Methylobacterium symbioticum]|uniref:patatin-like phospholipase family protein n=1 Tax=uncultured Methylobacterium sp. TaxID=157278 RepID=UPI0025993484|nr:patatin-like phospholipase family protein [uncultured Methylobacterium sp.]